MGRDLLDSKIKITLPDGTVIVTEIPYQRWFTPKETLEYFGVNTNIYTINGFGDYRIEFNEDQIINVIVLISICFNHLQKTIQKRMKRNLHQKRKNMMTQMMITLKKVMK